MFKNCASLADLNKRRAELVKEGAPIKAINAAYNVARKSLMASQSSITSFAQIPTFEALKIETKLYAVVNILGKASPNEVLFGNGGVYL